MTTDVNEEALDISNIYLGADGASKDALVVAESIYALAREVRAMRVVLDGVAGIGSISDRLEEIRDHLRVG